MKKYIQAWEYKQSGLSTQEIATLMQTDAKSVRKHIGVYRKVNGIKYVEEVIDYGVGICKTCGNEFRKKGTNHYYCSDYCSNQFRYKKQHRYVKVNRVEKYPIQEMIDFHQQGFTCVEIGEKMSISYNAVTYHLKKYGIALSTTKPLRQYKCEQCGKLFVAVKGNSKYCSKECRSTWIANHPRHTKECECCGKEFKTNIKDQIYCSTKCMGVVNQKKFRNEEVVNQYGTREQRENKFKEDFNLLFVGKTIYVDGFTDGDCRFNCKCLKCGAIYSLNAQVVRKKGNAECVVCLEQERLAKRELNIARRNLINTLKKVSRLQIKESKKIQRILDKQNSMQEYECIYCGKKFMSNSNKKYCSKECMKRSNDYHKSSRRREKIRSNGHYDWSISIPKLIKRDKVCKICGKPVDIHDKVNAKGTVMVGGNYPSVDHIIPVSKGGTHTWDNVQLAHVSCNVKKSDTTDVVARVGRVQLSLNV